MFHPALGNPTVRALGALYAGTFLSGAWAMVIPTIPVLATQFGVSAGAAAQIVTAFAIGKFIGTVVAGPGQRAAPGVRSGIGGPVGAVVVLDFALSFAHRWRRQFVGNRARGRGNRFSTPQSTRPGDQQFTWRVHDRRGFFSVYRRLAHRYVRL